MIIVTPVLIVLVASAIAYHCWNLYFADRAIRTEQTIAGYTRALEHDPSNAELWWRRGRLYQYSIQNADLDRAISDYKKALDLNERLAAAWVDLSHALEQAERFDMAESALDRAVEMQPYSPSIRWQAGNFFLRRSDLPRMYECFRTACRYDSSKLAIAMETAWKIDLDRDRILQTLIPDDFNANIRYLNFLIDKNELDLALAAWQRCLTNPVPSEIQLKPSLLFGFIDRLLSNNRTHAALKVWDDVLRKAQTGLSDARYQEFGSLDSPEEMINPVWNASFENEILRGGFDWRYPDIPEIRFRTDTQTRLHGLKSLEITFHGANISNGRLHQIIPIPSPGNYVLDFFIKTDGLTTDKMPYLSVTGYPDATGASARSDYFPSTNDWSKLSIPFEVTGRCRAIRLLLSRDRSSKFDNRIEGNLWLDGFTIQPYQPASVLP